MRADSKTSLDRDMFGGVLLYRVQRKTDTSISTQLLLTWKLRIDRLYSHVLLIEHEGTLAWDKDKLERLYDIHDSLYDTDVISNTGKWLLDNDAKLQTKCETSDEGRFEINITISEEKDLIRPRKPLWVDPNR
jgi:hypothetical protein